jgi:NitT/TauT family transport system substrate-binding protein
MQKFWTALVATLLASVTSAHAAQKLSLLTSWRAQAEHGGYYMALAKGYYSACGLDVTIRQGGPMIDGKQLLAAGAVDILQTSYTDDAFALSAAGAKVRGVAAFFQKNPQILMTHAGNGINSLEDMRGKPIMISAGLRATVWPFLREKYGFADTQMRSYTGQLAPWLIDQQAIQQGLITNEPYQVFKQTGAWPKSFLLADEGYGAYASLIVVSQKLIDTAPDAVQCFVNGSISGWVDFLKDPAPAVSLIRHDNPDNPDDLIANVVKTLKEAGIVETSDTAKYGLGAMTDARWKSHFDMLAAAGVVPKDLDYRSAYTLQFVNQRHGM